MEAIEFYLNQEQCDAVNAAREEVEGRQWDQARVRRQYIPIAPDPAMDDSYFVDRAHDPDAAPPPDRLPAAPPGGWVEQMARFADSLNDQDPRFPR